MLLFLLRLARPLLSLVILKNSNMKNLAVLTLVALSLLGPLAVSATPVSGEVLFSGNFSGDARVFGAATQFRSFSGVNVTGGTGLYAGLPSVPVAMDGFSFTSLTSPVLDVWDFSVNGIVYSFDLGSVEIVSRNRVTLVLQGTGYAHISGLDATAGTWTLTANGNTKTFIAAFDPPAAAAVVPDSGATTLGLFALTLVLLGVLRKTVLRRV